MTIESNKAIREVNVMQMLYDNSCYYTSLEDY